MSSLAEANLTRRKVVAAGIAGNVMEWYDFAVYGYFARTIGNLYFPVGDDKARLLAAFGAFAAGFLMRPIGAILFGYIGDRVGRGPSLLWSVVLMAAPTFCIGLLPSYDEIGLAAPVLMILFRLMQGLAVGGEYTGSAVFLAETAPKSPRFCNRLGAVWRHQRHPAVFARRRHRVESSAAGRRRRMGLARALPAGRRGWRCRLPPAPAHAP